MIRVSDLVVIRPPQHGGVFIAPQSLVAFVVPTSIVCTAARAARTLARVDTDSTAFAFLAAALVSACLFGITVSDKAARPRGGAAWVAAVAAAVFNGLLLYAAAVGIDKF